jgi:hypothetical protein
VRLTEEKLIDGNVYTITMLDGMRGWKVFVRLAKALAAGVGTLDGIKLSAIMDLSDLWDMDLAPLARALPEALGQLPEDEQEKVIRTLLEPALVDGVPLLPKFATHFQGRTLTLIKVLGFALSVNYENFRAALVANGAGRGIQEMRPSSETSSTSAGPPSA